MYQYILLSSLTWFILAVFYVLFLRNEKYFRYNRIFLLFGLFIGLIIPSIPKLNFLHHFQFSNIISDLSINLSEITITNDKNNLQTENLFNISFILKSIYLIGFTYFSFHLIYAIKGLKSYLNNNRIIRKSGYSLVITEKPIIAFSFFKYVFINEKKYNSIQKEKILLHEKVHVEQGHSYDIIFLEILKIIFWFNPIIYIYRSFLIETHEFLADNAVIQQVSKKTYGELLINQLQSGVQYNIANYFINSLIKNRIKMMYKTKSSRKWKYLISMPIIVLLIVFINSCQTENISYGTNTPPPPPPPSEFLSHLPPPPPKPANYDEVNNIFQIVEEMPRFPGCENETTKKEKESCAQQKLYQYLYSNLIYPKSAQEKNIEGKVIVKFYVDTDGNMKDIFIIKDIGGGCGEEVLKVLESMNHLTDKWIPGRQNNVKVNTYYTMPVVFKLNG